MNSNDKNSGGKFEQDFEAFLREDDSALTALYRKLPQIEPDANLDSLIKAQARRALQGETAAYAPPTQRKARSTWLPIFGTAAGVVFAAAVALRMGPQMWGARSDNAAPATKSNTSVVTVRSIDAPVPAPAAPVSPPAVREEPVPVLRDRAPKPSASFETRGAAGKQEAGLVSDAMKAKASPPPPPVAAAAPMPAQPPAPGDQRFASEPGRATSSLSQAETAASAAAPEAFPQRAKERPRPVEMDAVERKQAIATGAWQNLHESERTDATASTAAAKKQLATPATVAPAANALAAAPPRPEPARPASAPAQAKAASPPTSSASAPANSDDKDAMARSGAGFAAPPAAADSKPPDTVQVTGALIPTVTAVPEDPHQWLERIHVLLREHHHDDAVLEIRKFRAQYPNYELPRDLRQLK